MDIQSIFSHLKFWCCKIFTHGQWQRSFHVHVKCPFVIFSVSKTHVFCITVSISKLRNSTSYPLHCIVLLSQTPTSNLFQADSRMVQDSLCLARWRLSLTTQSSPSTTELSTGRRNIFWNILISHTDISVMMDVTINGFWLHFKEDLLNWFWDGNAMPYYHFTEVFVSPSDALNDLLFWTYLPQPQSSIY